VGALSRSAKVVWGLTGLIAVALAAVVVASAVWPHHAATSRRDRVAQYIRDVNTAQVGSAREANTIALAYTRFRGDPQHAAAQLRALAQAERAMRVVRTRVAAVRAPADARRLRSRLLRLLDLQVDFAGDVRLLGAYVPRVAQVDGRTSAASRRLSRALAGARGPARQARVFDDYAAAARSAADTLSRLRAPPEFDRSRRSQVARLRRLERLATQIAVALRTHRATGATALVRRFAAANASPAVALDERRAVLAYDRRLRAIDSQRAVVQRELARLERSL